MAGFLQIRPFHPSRLGESGEAECLPDDLEAASGFSSSRAPSERPVQNASRVILDAEVVVDPLQAEALVQVQASLDANTRARAASLYVTNENVRQNVSNADSSWRWNRAVSAYRDASDPSNGPRVRSVA